MAPGRAEAEVPSEKLLSELRERLLRRPECAPACADIPRLLLEVGPRTLRARMEVAAEADSGVALPGSAAQWEPERVLLDGKPARSLVRSPEGVLYLMVPRGVHQVVLEGSLPGRDTVSLALPQKPRRVEVRASGWSVDGLFEDGQAEEDLQLTRTVEATGAQADGAQLQPVALPPFLVVERVLSLGLTWQVSTQVRRVSPAGSAVVLAVPLLPGEAITTAEVRVEDGKALLNLGPQVTSVSWSSSLEQRTPLELSAPEGLAWTEVWRVEVGPTWHFETSGLPPLHPTAHEEIRVPEFRPWPGETLRLELSRPVGVGGQSLTVDSSELVVSPGQRATQAGLTLSLRSSRGGTHAVTLPEGAQLERVTIDGTPHPLRKEGARVMLPVVPGAQTVQLSWRQPEGLSSSHRTPAVDLGLPSVNATLRMEVPRNRWVLFTWGPRAGPAVLFWGLLLVVLAVAVGLGRVSLTPLRTVHWLLLGLGLSQVPVVLAATVAGWLLLVGWRKQTPELPRWAFNARQLAIVGLGLVALAVLVTAIRQGLLGQPEMQVEGNGSSTYALRWFQDRAGGALPLAGVFSLPLLVYRAAMLGWAMWLAFALLGWLKWAWGAFAVGGVWIRAGARTAPQAVVVVEPPPSPPEG